MMGIGSAWGDMFNHAIKVSDRIELKLSGILRGFCTELYPHAQFK